MENNELLKLREAVENARKDVEAINLRGYQSEINAYCKFCYLLLQLANANLEDMRGYSWQNAALARELIKYATPLEEYDHVLDSVYSYASRMAEITEEHPRLKRDLLRLARLALGRMNSLQGRSSNLYEYLGDDIRELNDNISLADSGKLDKIGQTGQLKRDPIEWTAQWEKNIDEADRIAYESLADAPRGMGFCHAFWPARRKALAALGIEWRSPAQMNPNVRFD